MAKKTGRITNHTGCSPPPVCTGSVRKKTTAEVKIYKKAIQKRRLETYRSAIDIEMNLWDDLGSKSRWEKTPPEINEVGLPFINRHYVPWGTKK